MLFTDQVTNFLRQSNYIEGETSGQALDDAYRAWRYAFRHKDDPISADYVLKIHGLLMRNLKPRIAGKLRTCDVYIGGVCKPYTGAPQLLKALQDHLDLYEVKPAKDDTKSKEAYAKFMHVHFEGLHPFEDGNGRVGRILYNIHRINMGLPLHVILERERQDYYQWFREKQAN